MIRFLFIGLGAFMLGGFAAISLYRSAVPFPHDIVARGEAFEPDNAVWLYQHVSEVFPTRSVSRAEVSTPLPKRDNALEGFSFLYEGQSKELDDLFTDMETTGLLVLHKGEIVHEQYAKGADSGTLFTTFSAVKSITSTLVGFALGDGAIESISDPLEKYIPELRGTAYEGVSIRQALQMSSGVKFDVDGPAGKDTLDFITDTVVTGKRRANIVAASYPRGEEPGTKFNYNTAESQILLWLVKEATGKSPSDYLEEKIWRPLGMAHDAAWNIDIPGPDGMEIGGAFFNMSLRDFARFGLFIEQDGVWEGQRLLPAGWVAQATDSSEAHLAHGTVFEGSDRGYGYQWWTFPNGSFIASGAYGQTIYIDQANDLVVARTSAWPAGWVKEYDLESRTAFAALGEFLNK